MMDCNEYIQRRVKLGYVPDSPTSVQLVDSIGNQIFDLLPIIQAGETITSIALLSNERRIRYYPEEWTRTEGASGCYYDICIPDLAALIDLNELRNVESAETLTTGDILVYNATTQQYEMYNLYDTLKGIDGRFDDVEDRVTKLEKRVSSLEKTIIEQNQKLAGYVEEIGEYQQAIEQYESRLKAIEDAIYNWATDKTTKIARGNINVTSGGYNGGLGIYTRTADTDNDLDFS